LSRAGIKFTGVQKGSKWLIGDFPTGTDQGIPAAKEIYAGYQQKSDA
jgi:hypothetical protein